MAITPTSAGTAGLTVGAKAGLGVGIPLGFVALIALGFFFGKRGRGRTHGQTLNATQGRLAQGKDQDGDVSLVKRAHAREPAMSPRVAYGLHGFPGNLYELPVSTGIHEAGRR